MTASYLTEALRACRLPIDVTADTCGWILVRGVHDFVGTHTPNYQHARWVYTRLRDRLLAEEKEKSDGDN